MSEWRVLKRRTHDAFVNMATDEAIMRARINDEVPNTLRFYLWNPSAVSIGKFQDMKNEVQLDNCRKMGVDVVRRITGGGAVYHDGQGELTYSVIARTEDFSETRDIVGVYSAVCAGLAHALKILDTKADFNEGNAKTCPNLTISGKKVSGSAQCHKKGVVLQHGTLLVKVNLEKMYDLLRIPSTSTHAQVINMASRKITSITKEAKRDLSLDEIESALVKGFQDTLQTTLKDGDITQHEHHLAKTLFETKYATPDWNLYGKNMENE